VIFGMTRGVFAEGVEEDIDVGCDHRRPSIKS
jgi:hypothetical protein